MKHSRPVLVNSLATGHTEIVRDALASMVDHVEPPGVWASRAHVFAEAIAPVMVWARDARGLDLHLEVVPAFLRFDELVAMAEGATAAAGAATSLLDWTELPAPLRSRVRTYLAELPGFVPGARTPDGGCARVHHAYTQRVLCLALL